MVAVALGAEVVVLTAAVGTALVLHAHAPVSEVLSVSEVLCVCRNSGHVVSPGAALAPADCAPFADQTVAVVVVVVVVVAVVVGGARGPLNATE